MQTDILIVGAGPAGLAAALHLARRYREAGREPSTIVIDKGREVGAHQCSGAVLDPRGMDELWPAWKENNPPIEAPVSRERLWFLTATEHVELPVPRSLENRGNLVITLSQFTRWLGKKAEEAGIPIFTEFAGERLVIENGRVVGVKLADRGVGKDGSRRPNYEPGIEIRAKTVLLCEGTLGTLTRQLIRAFRLDEGREPQTWSAAAKEVWRLAPGRLAPGRVIHTIGWPLPRGVFGGSFLYSLADDRLAIGIVASLDRADPGLDIHGLLQRLKQHPSVRTFLEGGSLLEFGAKTIPEGGLFSVPRLWAPGAVVAGDSAGFVNVMRLKGIHLGMKTGMLAADAALQRPEALESYEQDVKASWVWREMVASRYFTQGFKYGVLPGMLSAGIIQMTGGWSPAGRRRASRSASRPPVETPFDGNLTFAKTDSVYHSNTKHDEASRSHLIVPDPGICRDRCSREFGNPCVRFCPANVYEWMRSSEKDGPGHLAIGFGNCVHCKTCEIADPYGNIVWEVPEGGGGPNWQWM